MSTADAAPAPDASGTQLRRTTGWALGAALVAVAALGAYWQLFTTFRFWDDEGYVSISLRNFAAGGKLYGEVFSQYGPAYNLLFAALHRLLGVPLDTAGARWITWSVWVGSTLIAAGGVRRLTGSWLWGVAAGAAVFAQLRMLTHEPLHPVGLITLLLLAGTVGALGLLAAGRHAAACRSVAVAATLLLLVKINVGLFYFAALGVFVLWTGRGFASRPWARVVLAALAVLAGVALMRPLIAADWVQKFLVVYAFAAATTLAVLGLELRGEKPFRDGLRPTIVAAGLTLGFMLVVSVFTGMTGAQLWEGIVAGPLRHPGNFSYPFRWAGLTFPMLALNAIAFGLWLVLRRRAPLWANRLVVVCRLIVGAGFLFSFFHAFAVSVEAYLLSFGAGFLWALAAPLGTEPVERLHPRLLLAGLALLQLLHAFPVAGTQLPIATLLLALLIVLALHDVAAWKRSFGLRPVALALTLATVGLPLWGCTRISLESGRAYFSQPAENFSGARLHLSPWQTSSLATITANARWHGDMLFSLPGMFSFNTWTGLPTPNRQNITHWWSLLNDTQQAGIAAELDHAARPVVIVQRNLIESGIAKEAFHPSRLTRVITDRFAPLFSIDGYEFWVRRDANVHPLLIARWEGGANAAAFTFYSSDHNLAAARRLELRHFDLKVDDSVASLTAFALESSPLTADRLIPWNCKLTLPPSMDRAACDAARFYDAAGRLIAELRFERRKPQANPE